MTAIRVGDRVPELSVKTQRGENLSLGQFRGQRWLVIFFYPKDGTPVCTREACSFRDAYADFVDAGAVVIGVSGDSDDSHREFATQHRLPFHLVSDGDGGLRKTFGVPKTLGLLPGRVTYVVDPEGVVRHVFSSQLAAERHVQEALTTIRAGEFV
jgi:peroxiredoxin Q/BCP